MEEARLDLEAQNPLLINEIAKRILQFVPAAHLKDCRLVCKLWWKESLPRWRRSQWLNVTTNDSNAGRWDNHLKQDDHVKEEEKLHKCVFIGTYLNLLNRPGDPYHLEKYPFQKLLFFKCKLRFGVNDWKSGLLKEFCKRCGPFLTSLAIENCTIYTNDDFNKIIFRMSPKLQYLSLSDNIYKSNFTATNEITNLDINELVQNSRDVQPKLTHLKLSMVQMDAKEDDQLPLTWTQFFAHFPNIQNLELVKLNEEGGGPSFENDIEVIFQSIKALRKECGILKQLTGLDLLNLEGLPTPYFAMQYLNALQELCLPLTFLAYDIGYEHDENNRLSDLLRIGAESLEILIIYKLPLSLPFGDFPYGNRFPNLTKLTLVGPIVNDLRFLEQMPLLKSLRLFHGMESEYPVRPSMPEPKVLGQLRQFKNDTDFSDEGNVVDRVKVVENTDFSLMTHLSFPNLEEFIIGAELCSAGQIEEMAKLMRNVKRLRIGLDNGSFRAVCKFWSGLEGLDINPSLVDDEGFTGIVRGSDPDAARLPNLTDLKSLRKFGMGMSLESNGRIYKFTDFALMNGLQHLNYLEVVSLLCSKEEMSNNSFDELKARFPSSPYSSVYRNEDG